MSARVRRPGADRRRPATGPAPLRLRRHHDRECGELFRRRLPSNDAQQGTHFLAHNGMFPCFLGGRVWRLLARTRNALVTCTRVCDGGITAST